MVTASYTARGRLQPWNEGLSDHMRLAKSVLDVVNRNDPTALAAGVGLEMFFNAAELAFVSRFRSWHPILPNMSQTAANHETLRAPKCYNSFTPGCRKGKNKPAFVLYSCTKIIRLLSTITKKSKFTMYGIDV